MPTNIKDKIEKDKIEEEVKTFIESGAWILKKEDLVQYFRSSLLSISKQAREEVAKYIAGEIERTGAGLSSEEGDNTDYDKGYYGAMADIKELINNLPH